MVVAHARFGDPSDSPIADAALALLGSATSDLLAPTEPSELFDLIVEQVGALAATPHAYLCLMEPDGRFMIRAGSGIFQNLVGSRCPPGGGFSGRFRKEGTRAVIADPPAWSRRCKEVALLEVGQLVEVPLSMKAVGCGTLGAALLDSGAMFGATQVELLTHFGQLAALSLDNAHLEGLAQTELLERRRVEEELLDMIAWLERSEDELRRSRADTIARLAHAAEFRSFEIGPHVERMSRYCAALGTRIGLPEERIKLIRIASTLHDIGKIAVPDEILLKPGPLTPDERGVMQRHSEIGHEILTDSSSEVLELAASIALTHHERYDGTGYPRGLSGEAIPLEGRIAAVADVFDALRSDRVYRKAMPFGQAVALMRDGRGTHFDPELLDLFFECLSDIEGVEVPTAKPERQPARRTPNPRRTAGATPGDAETIDVDRLRESCRDALDLLEHSADGKDAIELAVASLARGWEGKLIVSVYLLEHQRLWVIAQRGYADVVHDGFPVTRGVMARAVRTGETQFVPDVSLDKDFIGATSGLVSEVAVPFPTEAPVGVFNIETLGIRLPEEAATIFDELAVALAMRLESMRQGLGLDIASLARLCVHASSLRGVSAIAEFATRTFGRFLGLESAQLVLRGSDGASRFASHWRRPDSQLAPISVDGLELLDEIRARDQSVVVFGVLPAADLNWIESDERDAPWAVWLPLRIAGTEIGTLVGRSSSREIPHEQIEAGSLIAQHAAALIDIAQRLRREQRAAATDPLTGLLNRRGFDERFSEEIARATRNGESLALLMIDCDGLKAINDLDGHEVGDHALQHVAACIRSNKRVSDVAARFGGDEFSVVLTDVDAEAALIAAERIRDAVAAGFPYGGGHLSASFGLALYPAHRWPAELRSAADAALYRAKREGGDCVRLAD
jgi:diguanylate cyclase (GGDEF)-like protein